MIGLYAAAGVLGLAAGLAVWALWIERDKQ